VWARHRAGAAGTFPPFGTAIGREAEISEVVRQMAQDNQIVIVGNLTRDPELRYTPNGAALVKFGVAVSRRVKDDATGQWKDADTSFFDVTAWRTLAENVAETLTQGSRVVVVGRLRTNSWETPEGEKRSKIEIEAEEIGPSLKWATAKVERQSRSAGQSDWNANVTVGAGGPQEETPLDG
jgi:single-strand DNA-binding protein